MKASLRHFLNPHFLVLSAVFLLHQIVERVLGWHHPWADSYLDPLLFMPILFHSIHWERRHIWKRGERYTIPDYELFVWWIAVSIITEYYFPKWQPAFVSDALDVLCYGIGTLYFRSFMNKRPKKIQG